MTNPFTDKVAKMKLLVSLKSLYGTVDAQAIQKIMDIAILGVDEFVYGDFGGITKSPVDS
ncbi:MAG TPA: hypothetical protein VJ972_08030 [Anaerolineales bacterium]|nr:hypothetical protein [Anaerolineales bacterium]